MEARKAVTFRIPDELLSRARTFKEGQESLNDVVVEALDREVRRRQSLAAHDKIVRIREQVMARTGPHADSTPYIRALREERTKRG